MSHINIAPPKPGRGVFLAAPILSPFSFLVFSASRSRPISKLALIRPDCPLRLPQPETSFPKEKFSPSNYQDTFAEMGRDHVTWLAWKRIREMKAAKKLCTLFTFPPLSLTLRFSILASFPLTFEESLFKKRDMRKIPSTSCDIKYWVKVSRCHSMLACIACSEFLNPIRRSPKKGPFMCRQKYCLHQKFPMIRTRESNPSASGPKGKQGAHSHSSLI